MILPFVDQQPLYATINFSGKLEADNAMAARTPVTVFLCPSDATDSARNDLFAAQDHSVWFTVGVTNYRGVAGSNWRWGPFIHSEPTGRNAGKDDGLRFGNGIFSGGFLDPAFWGPPAVTRPAHIADGMSNTLAVGESVADWCAYSWWYWHNWTYGTTAVPMNYCAKAPGCFNDWPVNFGFHSRHAGGAHFLKADGSVQFASESVDMNTYFAAATIDGGEVSSDF